MVWVYIPFNTRVLSRVRDVHPAPLYAQWNITTSTATSGMPVKKKKKMNFYHRYDRKIALCTFIMYNKQLHSLERHSNNANQTEIEKKREGGCHWLENNIKEVQAYHWLYTCEMHKRVVCIVLCIGSSPLISV